MKLTITTLSDDIFTLDVSDDLELENFKALCEFESGISAREIVIVYNGIPLLDEKKILKDYGIKDGDVLLLQHMHLRQTASPSSTPAAPTPPPIDFSEIEVPNQSESHPNRDPDDPAYIRDMFLSNPHELALLKENNPRLAEALLSGDIGRFSSVLKEQQHQHAEKERRRIRLMNADPFDPEAQRHIAEEIRMENIESNMETAMEYAPESFGQVVMLYINCSVNGHPVKAFVDSGAQTTLMSQSCAERCNIMRLVDQRWAGIAKGVGTQKIIGRVHLGQIQIGSDFLSSSFSILEEQPMDMLLGLDMLKRHQCCIDLKRNLLVIGTTGTETPFLNEGELPECARLNRQLSAPDQTIQESEDRELAEALMRSSEDSSTTSICTGSSTALNNHSSSSSSTSGVWSETSVSSTPSTGNLDEMQPKVPESDIARIIAMGFSREQVLEELQRNQGDINQTIAALFVKSLHF